MRITDVAVHLTTEICVPRKAEAVIKAVQQGEIDMAAVKAQIECRAARNAPLNPEIRIIRQVKAEEIDHQIIPFEHEGAACPLHRDAAVRPVQHINAAVNLECRTLRALSPNAEIGAQCAVQSFRQRSIRLRAQARKLHPVRNEMCRIREGIRIEYSLSRDAAAEGICFQIFKRNCAVRIGDIRRSIGKGNAVRRAFRCGQLPRRREGSERSRHVNIRRHGARIGGPLEDFIHGQILCTHRKVKIRALGVHADCAVHTRGLLLCRKRCREEEFTLIKPQCSTLDLCLGSVDIRRRLYACSTSVRREHAFCPAHADVHASRVQRLYLHLCRNCAGGKEIEQRNQILIRSAQLHLLDTACVLPPGTQGNAREHAREIIGKVAAINVRSAVNIGQRIGPPAGIHIRRRICEADAPLDVLGSVSSAPRSL